MHEGALAGLLTVVGLVGGCPDEEPGPADELARVAPAAPAPSSDTPEAPGGEPDPDDTPGDDSAPTPDDATDPPAPAQVEPADPPEPEPTYHRAQTTVRVFAEPSFSATFRGQIPRAEVFAVRAQNVEGDPGCDAGWARLGKAAFACLDRTKPTKKRPHALPVIHEGSLLPHVYFRRNKKAPEDAEPPGIWRSLTALRRGDDPIDTVQPHRDYAFVRRRAGRGGPFLIDKNHHVVKEKEVERMVPSDFAGRDLTTEPIPEGVMLAWSIHWPNTTVYAEPKEEAEVVGGIEFHETFYVTGETRTHRRSEFWEVAGEPGGWVEAKQSKRFEPFEAPPEVGDDQRWLDIDVGQQTLAIVEGKTPVFVTLVSSGSWKDPTPTGLFRLISKHGLDDMRSRPDEDDPYTVEAVPFAQYFDGRYGLHGTYWHNRFGLRTSHGCVNLSAKDAARVFALTSPAMPDGWLTVYEHADDPGTLVRIRKGSEHPEDKRGDIIERRRSDYGGAAVD